MPVCRNRCITAPPVPRGLGHVPHTHTPSALQCYGAKWGLSRGASGQLGSTWGCRGLLLPAGIRLPWQSSWLSAVNNAHGGKGTSCSGAAGRRIPARGRRTELPGRDFGGSCSACPGSAPSLPGSDLNQEKPSGEAGPAERRGTSLPRRAARGRARGWRPRGHCGRSGAGAARGGGTARLIPAPLGALPPRPPQAVPGRGGAARARAALRSRGWNRDRSGAAAERGAGWAGGAGPGGAERRGAAPGCGTLGSVASVLGELRSGITGGVWGNRGLGELVGSAVKVVGSGVTGGVWGRCWGGVPGVARGAGHGDGCPGRAGWGAAGQDGMGVPGMGWGSLGVGRGWLSSASHGLRVSPYGCRPDGAARCLPCRD